ELAGIRRAQVAAEAGMAACAALLREARAEGGELRRNGAPLLAQEGRAAIRPARAAHGARAAPHPPVARSDPVPGGPPPGAGAPRSGSTCGGATRSPAATPT